MRGGMTIRVSYEVSGAEHAFEAMVRMPMEVLCGAVVILAILVLAVSILLVIRWLRKNGVLADRELRGKDDEESNRSRGGNGRTNGGEDDGAPDDDGTIMGDDDDRTIAISRLNQGGRRPIKFTLADLRNSKNVYTTELLSSIVVGRSRECDIAIEGDQSISGKHFIVYAKGKEIYIIDNDSLNGVKLNGHRLRDKRTLIDGDLIEIGRRRYRVSIER